nr:hypothetical protein [uncultured Rhodopila sp.]
MQTSFARYLIGFAAALAGVLLAAWLYVYSFPMAFLESGYPSWVAKSMMLRDCRIGRIALFGDSRLEAGVVPALLPVDAANFGLGAATAVEIHSAVGRALGCAPLPRQVVLSLAPEHFGPLDQYFWLNDLRYGFISFAELLEAERVAAALGDTQSFGTAKTPDGLSGPVRDWLYAIRFPSFYIGSLAGGRLFGRQGSNDDRLAKVMQARGFWEYRSTGTPPPRGEPLAPRFDRTPLQTAEFEQTLDLLRDKAVPVGLLIMPVSEDTSAGADAAYLAYLQSLTERFPNVSLISEDIPRWPKRLFVDGIHMTGAAARLFTERLAACTTAGKIQPPCDLRWRETAFRQP